MCGDQARQWVAEELATDGDEFVNTFETTIRVLGGLLSAFILSPGDPVRSSPIPALCSHVSLAWLLCCVFCSLWGWGILVALLHALAGEYRVSIGALLGNNVKMLCRRRSSCFALWTWACGCLPHSSLPQVP